MLAGLLAPLPPLRLGALAPSPPRDLAGQEALGAPALEGLALAVLARVRSVPKPKTPLWASLYLSELNRIKS